MDSLKYLKFRGKEVNKSKYYKMVSEIFPFMEEVSSYFQIEFKDLRYYHFFEYCRDILNYEIIEVKLKGKLNGILAGSVMCEKGKIVIGCNKNMILGRKNFTKLHEITHALLDIGDNTTQSFSSLIGNENYSDGEIFQEIRADICSSYMLLNDEAIEYCISKEYTFTEIQEHYGISNQALEIRLKSYLVFNYNFHPFEADSWVLKFKS